MSCLRQVVLTGLVLLPLFGFSLKSNLHPAQAPTGTDSPGSTDCPSPVSLTVTVTTEEGAAIPNAFLFLRQDTAGEPRKVMAFELQLQTDEEGRASASVGCDYLDIFATAGGFSPAAEKVLITKDAHAFSIPLKVYRITRTTEVPSQQLQESDRNRQAGVKNKRRSKN